VVGDVPNERDAAHQPFCLAAPALAGNRINCISIDSIQNTHPTKSAGMYEHTNFPDHIIPAIVQGLAFLLSVEQPMTSGQSKTNT